MKISFSHLISLLWLLLFLFGFVNAVSASKEYQTYIIHLDHTHKPVSFLTHESWHRSILKSMLSSPADNKELLLYSYNHVMHGFSARLTPSQLTEIEKSPAHLATYPESFGKLLTTYSPKFLGLQQNFGIWPAASYGEDVIIGIIDSGIWPESESFKDEGMSPVPQRWKGTCENGTAFSPSACNRKLIGARSFSKGLDHISKKNDFNSTRDFFGHGTHTASIAAGNHVHDVSYFGYARGTAKGVAPGARLAMYKVVWDTTTEMAATTDILAGMEQAILDGVDIMSLSLGINQTSYFTDVMAIGSLSAIEKGIFVVCSGGNFGDYKTVINAAPWITTVGASTLDRSFLATMTLENGDSFEGTSYFPESVFITDSLLYYGKGNTSKAICIHRALDRKEVAGKVVLCDYSTKINVSQQIKEVERVGAYAAIFLTDMSFSFICNFSTQFQAFFYQLASGKLIKEYVTRERNPKELMVLAAVSPIISFIKVGSYDLVTDYQLLSGTSMATPHVAGVGALLKAVHPEWSPAAVRSAMMTTAYAIDNTGTILKSQLTGLSGTPLDFGAGHINPNKAMDPGLIYDMGFQDYIEFLCNLGYTKKQMSVLIRRTQWSCSHKFIHDLNYPSFTAVLTNETRYPVAMNFSRIVTNVGNEKAVYRAHLENIPTGMRISVKPKILTFTRKYQNQSFVVSIELDREFPRVIFGFLKWIDQDSHIVSSPIVAINF
uniref:Subtilisin-like protease fibronectin type-III domain-containing protein n=1 Tax=Fagus sylvatica TaxID=28930 RepID=A0A2N9FAM7_FAGSY